MNLTRTVLFLLLYAMASLIWANELQVLAIKEQRPGVVLATVSLNGPMPIAGDFALQFGDSRSFSANDIKVATVPPRPTRVLLLVDTSGSISPANLGDIKSGLKDVAQALGPEIELTLIAFGTQPISLGEISAEPSRSRAIDSLKGETGPGGKTKLYDAMGAALSALKPAERSNPKRLIIISDMKDEGSVTDPDSVARKAKALGVPILGIGFGRLAAGSAAHLKPLADGTGGELVLAKNKQDLTDALRRFLTPEPSGSAYEVAFNYPPAPAREGQPVRAAARLQFSPVGKPQVVVALPNAITAPQEAASTEPGAGAQKEPTQPQTTHTWEITFLKVNFDVRILLVLLAAAAALVGWAISRKRAGNAAVPVTIPTPPPPPPPPVRRSGTVVAPLFPPPGRDRPAAVLFCRNGPSKGKWYAIDKPVFRIGAGATNDLRLTGDEYISGEHASIRYDSGSLYAEDHRSRNGTFLNDIRLGDTTRVLSPGDQIRVGKTTFELQLSRDLAGEKADGKEPIVS
jgi:hypothetical protein